MGSLHEDFSVSYHNSGSTGRLHVADIRPQTTPNTTGYQRSNNGGNYIQTKLSSSAAMPVTNGRMESWQQQQQPVHTTRSAPPSVATRQANKVRYPSSSSSSSLRSRRDYIDNVPQWSISNDHYASSESQSRTLGRPMTPADIECSDNRLKRLVSDSTTSAHVTSSSAGRRYVSPVGSILKLAPRHDRVAVVESSSLSSWNDEKDPVEVVHKSMAKGGAGRNVYRSRAVNGNEPPPPPPPRISRSRASSSSPTRSHRTPPGGGTIGVPKSTPSTTPRTARRVLFKNNVAVYRFDSDSGADSSAHSSISESSELLNGEPRHHHGNRQQQHQQQRIGSGCIRQNGHNGMMPARPQAPVPGDPVNDRPHVIPMWYGPTNGSQLVGSSLRQPMTSSTSSAGPAILDRLQSPASIHSNSEQQQSTLWVNDPKVSCQMQALNRSTTVVRIRYAQVQDGNSLRIIITCQLRSGSYWDSDDIVVKANRSGSRVRIVFGGGGIVGPSDQLILPVTVDPHRLVARLDSDTSLVIEAPVIHQ